MKKIVALIIFSILSSGFAHSWSTRPGQPSNPPITKQPQAVGDVVGRDLNYAGLGSLGHVGIWTGSRVLEVLNESRVVQQNSLRNFHDRSKWWGAKYNMGWTINWQKMIDDGWDQRRYNPTYTIRTSYTVGKSELRCNQWAGGICIDRREVVTPGEWRCDTFVNWSYRRGAGVWLDPSLGSITPRRLYGKLRFAR